LENISVLVDTQRSKGHEVRLTVKKQLFSKYKSNKMVYTILLVVGSILLLASIYYLKSALAFVQKGEKTTARLVDYEVTKTGKGGTQYRPIFKFKPFGKDEVEFRHAYQVSRKHWEVGDDQNIAYDTDDPKKVRLLTYFGLFTPAIYLAVFAFPLIVIGAGYFWSQNYFQSLGL
jgi:Protein of unknown function (DUF3592)